MARKLEFNDSTIIEEVSMLDDDTLLEDGTIGSTTFFNRYVEDLTLQESTIGDDSVNMALQKANQELEAKLGEANAKIKILQASQRMSEKKHEQEISNLEEKLKSEKKDHAKTLGKLKKAEARIQQSSGKRQVNAAVSVAEATRAYLEGNKNK